MYRLHLGNCLHELRNIPENSIDSVVTDPPYELGFMGKSWDASGIAYSVAMWQEVLRVLKPGGHLLAFSGSRTYHRMTCAIEDAGFEVRDQMLWVYGSGFPKSLDVSKAIDKAAGAERELTRPGIVQRSGYGEDWDTGSSETRPRYDLPATQAAKQWQGWGTALKPSFEPLCVATKPLPAARERDIIDANLLTLEARLWSLSLASAATRNSTSNQRELNAACAIAQWTVEESISMSAALCEAMGTSLRESRILTSLNIVSSWRHTLGEFSNLGSTSITETKSDTTTDWKTLKFCLLRITPLTITMGLSIQHGLTAFVSSAERYFDAELKRLQAILELSALENVMSQERIKHLDVDAKAKHEPICVARKPLAKGLTVAANVLAHGTGALNIDGCRVPGAYETRDRNNEGGESMFGMGAGGGAFVPAEGRWPANLIHDGSDGVLALFPDSSVTGKRSGKSKSATVTGTNWLSDNHESTEYTDSGSAARFFYCAKTSKKDRNEGLDDFAPTTTSDGRAVAADNAYQRGKTERANTHPTVKPTDLMKYLCRLVTPPGGTVLDPFMGSGSTGKAAMLEGFKFVGIEMDESYHTIAKARIEAALVSTFADMI